MKNLYGNGFPDQEKGCCQANEDFLMVHGDINLIQRPQRGAACPGSHRDGCHAPAEVCEHGFPFSWQRTSKDRVLFPDRGRQATGTAVFRE